MLFFNKPADESVMVAIQVFGYLQPLLLMEVMPELGLKQVRELAMSQSMWSLCFE